MGDVAEMAGFLAEFLDELLVKIEGLSARLDELEASGELTPELVAEVAGRIDRVSLWLPFLVESVEPVGTPLLRLKRRLTVKVVQMMALGMTGEEVRSSFAEMVEATSSALGDALFDDVQVFDLLEDGPELVLVLVEADRAEIVAGVLAVGSGLVHLDLDLLQPLYVRVVVLDARASQEGPDVSLRFVQRPHRLADPRARLLGVGVRRGDALDGRELAQVVDAVADDGPGGVDHGSGQRL